VRFDELERLLANRATAAAELPAWRRKTHGEARWQVAFMTAAGIALQVMVPAELAAVRPAWVLPVIEGFLLLALVVANPARIDRESAALRRLSLGLSALLSFANAWSVVRLIMVLIQGGAVAQDPAKLLITGGAIWATNVVAFALWYWEFDRGGPVARAHGADPYPDFQFVQMTAPDMAPPHWEPAFADYLYLAFTNATAFSPTDVMPLSRWAKMAMTVQSAISLVTMGLIVARAVNILKLGGAFLATVPYTRTFRERNVPLMLLPTSLVGSYAQPEWLIDRSRLASRFPPRVRAKELWRVDPDFLAEAQNDATLLAIRAQEDAGLDIITDGEIRRESYSNRFATALEGVDIDNPGTALDRSGHPNPVPRVTGPVKRRHPVEVDDVRFLRMHTSRTVKITVPGPFTMAQQAQDDYYGSTEALAHAYADVVNEEVRDLFAAGADIVQLDEPYLQARAADAAKYGVDVVNRALAGTDGLGTRAVHVCFGYAAIIHERPSGYSFLPELAECSTDQISIETAQSGLDCSVLGPLAEAGKTVILGVLDLSSPEIETPELVVERVRRALPYVPAAQLVLAPDCGLKYLPRDSAFGKLTSLSAAAVRLRAELGA
jgi:5-methyltetrahydropteroyltriglutamate--homocysteine methyltransferase